MPEKYLKDALKIAKETVKILEKGIKKSDNKNQANLWGAFDAADADDKKIKELEEQIAMGQRTINALKEPEDQWVRRDSDDIYLIKEEETKIVSYKKQIELLKSNMGRFSNALLLPKDKGHGS